MDEGNVSSDRVRRRILAEHRELRKAIAKVNAADDPYKVTLAARALLDRLIDHLDLEDQILEPLLRGIDAWGPERARRLREEHASQRTQVATLRTALATAPTAELATLARLFVDELLADMADEERDVLNAELLRDDCITVEFGG